MPVTLTPFCDNKVLTKKLIARKKRDFSVVVVVVACDVYTVVTGPCVADFIQDN
jgi:hypothetical protein